MRNLPAGRMARLWLRARLEVAGRAVKVLEQKIQALMEIWLYVHVPLTLGLIAALTAHIVSVLFYW